MIIMKQILMYQTWIHNYNNMMQYWYIRLASL